MDYKLKMYIVGTEWHPTQFLMKSGKLTDDVRNAAYYTQRKDAYRQISASDDPDILRIFDVDVTVLGL